MAGFIKELPMWNAAGVKPPQSKLDNGWTVAEKPPADWFNWQQYTTYKAVQELQQNAVHKDGSTLITTQTAGDNSQKPANTAYIDSMAYNTPAPTAVNLGNGLQVITAPKGSPYNVLNIVGRTLVNLLGRDGNCEDLSKWGTFQTTITLDATNKTIGNNSIKGTMTGTNGTIPSNTYMPLKAGKYYVAVADLKNGNATNISAYVENVTGASNGGAITSTSSFNTFWTKFTVASDISSRIIVQLVGSSTQYAYVDAVRIYEITLAEYNAIATMTTAQIASKYPYVDDVKHVNAPYVIKYGENLLPSFDQWTLHANAVATVDYTLTHVATATDEKSYVNVKVLRNTDYTIKTNVGNVSVSGLDTSTYLVNPVSFGTYTFNSGANDSIQINLRSSAAGTFAFTNPMLNLGATAKLFKPRNDDMLAFPNVQLASSVDGVVYDSLFKRDGKYFVEKRFRDMVLDGSLAWAFSADMAGFKQLSLSNAISNSATITGLVTKYDGKIIKNGDTSASSDINFINNSNVLFLTVADTDSGWGEGYTPTTQEIQAYFYGWKMYDNVANPGGGGTYNGSGSNKAWCYRNNAAGTTFAGGVIVVPTTHAPVNPFWTSDYKLTYQLATPTFEEIQVDAGMSLHEGLNQIEVGQGVVVREKVTPILDVNMYRINAVAPSSATKYRIKQIVNVYKNGRVDGWNKINRTTESSVYGIGHAEIFPSSFDSTATYEISYIALDQYLLSAPVQTLNGETASNLKTVVDTLATNQADQDARIAANELLARQIYSTVQKTTAALNLYVDGTNGADNNDGSAGKPFKTIGRALNSIPKDTDHNNKIFIADGTYSEDLFINGFMGGGEIRLIGNSAAITNVKINSIQAMRNTAYINLSYLQVIGETPIGSGALWAYGCTNIVLSFITTTNVGQYGLNIMRCFSTVNNCTVSNKTVGGLFVQNATIISDSNGGTGNAVGLYSTVGAYVGKAGTQPTGTIPEAVNTGGTISSGVLNPWGDNTQANRSGADANIGSAFTITSASVFTKLPFSVKFNDNLSEFDTTLNRFVAKSSGKYRVSIRVALTNANAGTRLITQLYKNGGQYAQMSEGYNYTSTGDLGTNGGMEVPMNAGEYLEFYAFSTMASAVVNISGVVTYVNITRIA